MKNTLKVSTFVVATTLLASAGAHAQDGSSNSTGGATSANRTTTVQTEERQEQPNYSLLGLAGLAGLLKKPERQVVHQTDTVRTTGSGPTTGTGAKY